MEPPEPSPAPTLDPHFPGYYPPTPSLSEAEAIPGSTTPSAFDHSAPEAQPQLLSRSSSSTTADAASPSFSAAQEASESTPEHEKKEMDEQVYEATGKAILGVAAGLVGGGLVGAAVGGGLVGHGAAQEPAGTEAYGDEKGEKADGEKDVKTPAEEEGEATSRGATPALDAHEAFGTPAVEKEQKELEQSPAQQLLAAAETDGSGDKQAGEAILLEGASGAKVIPNEIEEPHESSEAGATTSKALESEFGTPAIEKEQADLAKSPAQRLLAESASSAGTATPPLAAEAALLGTAAAGAAAVGKVENEVEEPATVPVDEAVKQDVQAGAGVPTQATEAEKGNEEVTAVPLGESTAEKEEDRPELPKPSGSLESFSGAVLAASRGVDTPSIAPGPAVGGFGEREEGTIVVTDRDLDGNGPKETGSGFLPLNAPEVAAHDPTAEDSTEDDAPRASAQDKGKGRELDLDEALAVAAAAGGGGFAAAFGTKSFRNEDEEKPSPSRTTSAFTENLATPAATADSPKSPLWEQRAEPPTSAQVTEAEPERAVDPHQLAAEAAPATSPEQAGFTGVAPGQEPTPAMQDFAHLSEPAPAAEQAALDPKSDAQAPEAGSGLAGIGAGNASMRSYSSSQQPVSRFTESIPPAAAGASPAFARPRQGSPTPYPGHEQATIERSPHMKIATSSVDGHKRLHRKSLSKGTSPSARSSGEHDRPAGYAAPPPQGFAPVQQPLQPLQPVPAQAGGAPPQDRFMVPVHNQPVVPPPQQTIPSNAGVSGPTGAAGATPVLPSGEAEARRDRMMDSMTGVRDPLVAGAPASTTAPSTRPTTLATGSSMGSYGSSPLSHPAARRNESDHSAFGEAHNRTYPGAPPTAPGVTAVMMAAIPGMATSPPVGGMPIPHQQQQQQQQQQQRQQPALQQQPQMQTQPLSPGAPPAMAQAPPGSVGSPGQGAPGHGNPAMQQQQQLPKRGQHERASEKERKESFFSKLFSSGGSRRSREGSEGSRHSAAASPRASTEAGRS
ncbi:hypothetical protein JCM8202_000011 [Rhodotorula sphaerocarpa]